MGFVRNLLGSNKDDAAVNAKNAEIAAANEAKVLFDPAVQLGSSARDLLLNNVLGPLQNPSLPQAQTAQDVINNPFFQALSAQNERSTLARNAALGLAGSGGTQDALTRNLLLLGNQFQQQDLSNQQQNFVNQNSNFVNTLNSNQQRFNQLLNLNNVGDRALSNQANIITGKGSAEAAGIIAEANAKTSAAGNAFKLGTQAIGGLFGLL